MRAVGDSSEPSQGQYTYTSKLGRIIFGAFAAALLDGLFEHPCQREWVACRSEVVANTDGEGEDAVGRAKCEGVGGVIAMSR